MRDTRGILPVRPKAPAADRIIGAISIVMAVLFPLGGLIVAWDATKRADAAGLVNRPAYWGFWFSLWMTLWLALLLVGVPLLVLWGLLPPQ